ncbi:glycosyltransferase family 2 protein [Endothiovibrio diazotrophicus]
MTPLSVLIPTKNEERNLPDCLASVAWAGERVVFDSLSDDRTVEIAEAHGARVVRRPFDNFSRHKNWALEQIDFAHPWVLLLDADERVTPALAEEIQRLFAAGEPPCDGYYIAREILWRGRVLRHGGRYPDYNLRLLQVGRGRYEERLVHEHMILDGEAGYLQQPLSHDDDKGIERYIERHNHYSTLEAVEILREREGAGEGLTPDLRRRGPQRRRALKSWAYRHLPARPLFVFLYLYLLRLGFLDGRAGLDSALLRAIYEYQIDLKLIELGDPDSPLARRRRTLER